MRYQYTLEKTNKTLTLMRELIFTALPKTLRTTESV